ncbi:MAG: anaerobic ribonucleoside-triphosphate reductase activating protein [Oscillospiraceae bacterium]|nr:anaerobic ribonucleoside-triphosphate reductase activating protein [Oscillospiraceae bacterium]
MLTDTENNTYLRIAGITDDSIVDGPGIRLTIFVQGCPHNCEGCHNPQTHDFSAGTEISIAEIMVKISANPLLDGVTFSGGEPFCQAKALSRLGSMIRKKGLDIIAYSGYTYEYLKSHADCENYFDDLLNVCDYLVDGPFILAERNIDLRFRGSANQRIIDLKKTAKEGRMITAEL